jgi:hypothetical protein
MASRTESALVAAVLPLAAATLVHQRQASRPDTATLAWQSLPTRVRCLLEHGASAWLVDRVHDLARDLALHNAMDGMSEEDSLEQIADAIWQQEVERHQPGIARSKNQRAAESYIALLEGAEPCTHFDAEHARPSEFYAGRWRWCCECNITITYVESPT